MLPQSASPDVRYLGRCHAGPALPHVVATAPCMLAVGINKPDSESITQPARLHRQDPLPGSHFILHSGCRPLQRLHPEAQLEPEGVASCPRGLLRHERQRSGTAPTRHSARSRLIGSEGRPPAQPQGARTPWCSWCSPVRRARHPRLPSSSSATTDCHCFQALAARRWRSRSFEGPHLPDSIPGASTCFC